MKILRMTDEGKSKFIDYLDRIRTQKSVQFPTQLLGPSAFAEEVGGDTSMLDNLDLSDKLQTAKGLSSIVERLELASAERDWGFWTWCSAYLFDRLCKRGSQNQYKPGEISIWVADPQNYQRYYRHYLASIWQVYAAHSDKESELGVLLSGPVNTPGELWAQIAATQTLITNRSMIDAVYQLYWDEESGARKRGAGGESPRRLTQVLKQFEKTYDFFAMSGEQIVRMLPAEFDRFKRSNMVAGNMASN